MRQMFAPLSEYLENELGDAFCKEFRVYGTYEKIQEWEEYKKAFVEWTVNQFTKDPSSHPRHPFEKPWEDT